MTTDTLTTILQVGDIMYSSWGYDQTNVDFYKVTRTTKASAWIVKIGSRSVEGSDGFMSCRVVPDPSRILCDQCNRRKDDRWHGEGERDFSGELRRHDFKATPEMHRIRKGWQGKPTLTLTSYSSASLWEKDGRGTYCSWYA